MHQTLTKTLRFRLKDRHAATLRDRSRWVNLVWNYCNDLSMKIRQREGKYPSAYDLHRYLAGSSKAGIPLHSQTIQAIADEYVTRRKQVKKHRLNWRVSNRKSPKYSLGWMPFKASAVQYRDGQVHISGVGALSLWDSYGLKRDTCIVGGSIAEDARGRWHLNLCVKQVVAETIDAPATAIGIDLGCGTAAITTDPDLALDTGWYRGIEKALATAQRAGKKKCARALHAKAANRRKDAIAKFSRSCSERYGFIFIGNVSSQSQIDSGRAKGALDAGWGLLRTQLRHKCHEAGAVFAEVNEAYSTQTCSCCYRRTGPKGVAGLGIREWTCTECGSHHDRDGNAARNILEAGHGLLAGGISGL